MPGESSAVPTEDRVGLNHLQTSPPTGPESRQHNPQESVAAVEAQATRRVLLENRKLVTKREDLRLQGRTGSKTGGYQSEKGDEKRVHRGSHHDLTDRIIGNQRRATPPVPRGLPPPKICPTSANATRATASAAPIP